MNLLPSVIDNWSSPPPKSVVPVKVDLPPSASVSLPVPNRMSPAIDGAAAPVAPATCRTTAPMVLARRSMATLRADVAVAPEAVMVPLFSTRGQRARAVDDAVGEARRHPKPTP